MKNAFLLFLLIACSFSCSSPENDNKSLKTMTLLEKQRYFAQCLEGVWIAKDYADSLPILKSPYRLRQKINWFAQLRFQARLVHQNFWLLSGNYADGFEKVIPTVFLNQKDSVLLKQANGNETNLKLPQDSTVQVVLPNENQYIYVAYQFLDKDTSLVLTEIAENGEPLQACVFKKISPVSSDKNALQIFVHKNILAGDKKVEDISRKKTSTVSFLPHGEIRNWDLYNRYQITTLYDENASPTDIITFYTPDNQAVSFRFSFETNGEMHLQTITVLKETAGEEDESIDYKFSPTVFKITIN